MSSGTCNRTLGSTFPSLGVEQIENTADRLSGAKTRRSVRASHAYAQLGLDDDNRQLCLGPELKPMTRATLEPVRPGLRYYLTAFVRDFVELHGDRCYGDDPAIVTGLGRVGTARFLIIGHDRGNTAEQHARCNYGSMRPEGYRKVLRKVKLAEKFGLPVLSLIDTPGADFGVDSEQRGQASVIAHNLREMSRLRTPIIGAVIGEVGVRGEPGMEIADQMAIMQYAYPWVVCGRVREAVPNRALWRMRCPATSRGATAEDLLRLRWVDEVIPEPLGGAGRDPQQAACSLRSYILCSLDELLRYSVPELLTRRYRRLGRLMG